MKKFVAYLEKKDPTSQKVITHNSVTIITDNDKNLSDDINMFKNEYGHEIGQPNLFGAVLVKIEQEKMDNKEFFVPVYYDVF